MRPNHLFIRFLSYLRAEAQRINADVREIIPRDMDSNPIVDWRLESVIAVLPRIIVGISYVGHVNILLTCYISCFADVASFPRQYHPYGD